MESSLAVMDGELLGITDFTIVIVNEDDAFLWHLDRQ